MLLFMVFGRCKWTLSYDACYVTAYEERVDRKCPCHISQTCLMLKSKMCIQSTDFKVLVQRTGFLFKILFGGGLLAFCGSGVQ